MKVATHIKAICLKHIMREDLFCIFKISINLQKICKAIYFYIYMTIYV